MNIGVIGTGNLGRMLIDSFIKNRIFPPERIYIFNRTAEKAERIKDIYPGINLARSSRDVIEKGDWIFICVKPPDLPSLLGETGTSFPENKLIISTLLVPYLEHLDAILKGKIIRIYPSITQSTGYGVTLVTFGKRVADAEKQEMLNCLNRMGKAFEIPEKYFRIAGDITSCGPAFMAFMTASLARTAQKYGLDEELALEMAGETMLGTALLIKEKQFSFQQVIEQVATPGGCTAAGIEVLNRDLYPIIENIFLATRKKENEVSNNVMKCLDTINR
ncbi:pyrroline-5-carboxylate reductase family protein [Desulfofundulus thermocisternus]|uniref:pyrroline-5-carboxylate reductase family protein n=1 Tax=Desulfofundulus thermocisternus TaxID=42471 RepID=UPI00217CCC40|nr:pyrroline-5-carboxylate reductase dimerization domain-containing protein [Desulfofundulus thermocisternus]MCS5695637.1 NAD(P)-binding domain-containing protein [Desulfofundulus thermocisternus]